MSISFRKMRISTINALVAGAVFLLAGIILIAIINKHERHEANENAEAEANIILNHYLATRVHFSHRTETKLGEFNESNQSGDEYDPIWVSRILAVLEIDRYYKTLSASGYYYKESAINARNPANEADSLERAFIAEINADPNLTKHSSIEVFDDKPYFTILHRGLVVGSACLRCHGDPADAPPPMIRTYGAKRSFHRKVGEIVSAISIRVPLSAAYIQAHKESFRNSAFLIIMLGILLLLMYWLDNRLVARPLSKIRDKALQISASEEHLGDQVPQPAGKEFSELASAFNKMSSRLASMIAELEERVEQRTAELVASNLKLSSEIEGRKQIEQERELLIADLKEALAQVKTLSGFIPICASCKNIRDDKGYWNQLEAYIKKHSHAEFSHSLCPKCARELYPEIYGKD